MSQVPPPPPSQPVPSMGAAPSGVGTNKKTYTILAYLLGWLTGIIFLFVGKDDPDVKWNSANSIVVFGGLAVIAFVLGVIPFLHWASYLVSLVGFVYWIIFMVKAFQGNGERIEAPFIGPTIAPYVQQLADGVK